MTLDPKQNVNSQIDYMLSNCEMNLDCLDDWQQAFVASIRKKFNRGAAISDREIEKLEECHQNTP